MAAVVQRDLVAVTLTLLRSLVADGCPARSLVLVGGVALNSSLVAAVAAEVTRPASVANTAGTESTDSGALFPGGVHVPPFAGDEGIAAGCAAYGAAVLEAAGQQATGDVGWGARADSVSVDGDTCVAKPSTVSARVQNAQVVVQSAVQRKRTGRDRFSPYLGAAYPPAATVAALEAFAPWTRATTSATPTAGIAAAAAALADGGILAWYDGRAEAGARALGARSLLAVATSRSSRHRLNARIKRREAFRPFAPVVRAEEAGQYFHPCSGGSGWMTACVRVRREWTRRLPAVVHVDGTARVQLLERRDNEQLWALLGEVRRLTGVGVLLNTSMNVAGEPLVETPSQALTLLLRGGVDALVLDGGRTQVLVRVSQLPAPPLPTRDGNESEDDGGGTAWECITLRVAAGVIPFEARAVSDGPSGTVSRVELYTAPRPPVPNWGGVAYQQEEDVCVTQRVLLDGPLDLRVLHALAARRCATVAQLQNELDGDAGEVGGRRGEAPHGGEGAAALCAAIRRLVALRLLLAEATPHGPGAGLTH